MTATDLDKLPRRAVMASPLPRGWCLLAAFAVSFALWGALASLAMAVH